jgi:sec-independent protein translocase protein TatA
MELFSPGHLVVLAIIVLILFFGWKQLPDMSRSLGRSLRIFRTELKGMAQDDKARAEAEQPKAIEPPAPAPAPAPARPRPTPSPVPRVDVDDTKRS